MPLRSRLSTIARGLDGALDRAVARTADAIAADARGLVPVDTGALRTSIEVFGAEGTGARTVEAGQSLDYAVFVEQGTGRQAAQPYMAPAAQQADLAAAVRDEIGRLTRGQP